MTEVVSGLSARSDRELVEACLGCCPRPDEAAASGEGAANGGSAHGDIAFDNADAWEALIRRYERLIYSVPIRLGMSQEEAVDVFQSVCLIMFRKLPSLRKHERVYSWLITTTTRECLRVSAQNSRKNDRERAWAAACGCDASAEQLAIERHLLDQHNAALRAALAELPPKCRELLTALYFVNDEPSYECVAKQINMPVSSIGPTRGRCLQKLKKLFHQKLNPT